MTPKIHSLDELGPVRDYLNRIGASVRSLKTAVVLEKMGKYTTDKTTIRFTKDGIVSCDRPEFMPSEAEQAAIKEAFASVQWPSPKLLPSLITLPEQLKTADDYFEFKDLKGNIIMLQGRFSSPDGGEKYYLPFTYWDDEQWRQCEPEGLLPLWGLDRIKDNSTVFIHEGAKAARAVQDMIEAKTVPMKAKLKEHPWGEELGAAVHLGWIGGALSPNRTDWSILADLPQLKQAYIVSDNDKAGLSAVAPIAFHLRMPTFHLQFTNEWPAAFDLADKFPDSMFKVLEEKPRYIGPSFRACLHPATFATDLIPNSKDSEAKPTVALRDHFKDMFAYIEEADTFVCKALPSIIRQEKILNNMLAPFSHAPETSTLILKAYTGRTTKLCYRPDKPEQVLIDSNSSAINLHIPTLIKSEPGSPAPFLDYLKYMFPVDFERKEVERWIATLVARPDIRMEYALLLISENQGIGKTTLGSVILSPLVNPYNVGWPRERDIVDSDFNEWVANKRLVIVNEIYSGHSWKAYHSLKSLITDKDLMVNQKFQRPYIVENWAHIFACSNSLQALKMEDDDRRWLYPELSEERWPRERFTKFRDWLASGGLGIIKSWAEGYENYVMPGERAPMTRRKREMIEGSRSEAQAEAHDLAGALAAVENPSALAMKDVVAWVRASVQGKVFDSDYELRKAMVMEGIHILGQRLRVQGRLQYIIMNAALYRMVLNLAEGESLTETVTKYLAKPNELMESEL